MMIMTIHSFVGRNIVFSLPTNIRFMNFTSNLNLLNLKKMKKR